MTDRSTPTLVGTLVAAAAGVVGAWLPLVAAAGLLFVLLGVWTHRYETSHGEGG